MANDKFSFLEKVEILFKYYLYKLLNAISRSEKRKADEIVR